MRIQYSGFRIQESGVRRLFLFILPTSPRNAHAVTTPHPTPHFPITPLPHHPTSPTIVKKYYNYAVITASHLDRRERQWL
ncbi:MAG: hypothetical protein PX481_28945 [Microcystis sp. M53603_WE2]|uniref:hypothetical protein n=1 Tax=Microcystis sp. M53603_WE2 TaxID=3030678 RepID=UPI00258CAEA0|nr:hypothetical protein [Microcystis sp. M53603_WE2]MDJ0542625.1 hypothetical protein [Microcystis sp. M53603_WE2]